MLSEAVKSEFSFFFPILYTSVLWKEIIRSKWYLIEFKRKKEKKNKCKCVSSIFVTLCAVYLGPRHVDRQRRQRDRFRCRKTIFAFISRNDSETWNFNLLGHFKFPENSHGIICLHFMHEMMVCRCLYACERDFFLKFRFSFGLHTIYIFPEFSIRLTFQGLCPFFG